jgi:GT2 family glycosyltransferase
MALVEASQRSPDFGIIGPALWWLGQDRPWSYGGTLSKAGTAGQIRDRVPEPDGHGIAPCEWIEGAAMLIRAEVFRDVGLLDERFFIYFEETEFCLRASRVGWRVGVALNAVVEQAPGASQRPGAYSYLLARNGLECARLAAGLRGIAAAMGHSLRESLRMLRIFAGRRSQSDARKWALMKLVATWLGIGAFVMRRWGPPPRIVPGLGDIKVAD